MSFEHLRNKQSQYQRNVLVTLLLALLLILIVALSIGEVILWPTEWGTSAAELFIWQLRLPRILAVMTVGASLAVCGAIMQALFENPLAEPGILGVSNGAGVSLVIILMITHGFIDISWLSFSAIVGAMATTFFLLLITHYYRLSNSQVLLVGVAIGIIAGALMTWCVYFSSTQDLRQLMYWMMGSFGGIDWRQKELILFLLPVLIWLMAQGNKINLLGLGAIQAKQLGLALTRWRILFILGVGWLIGVSVALAGVIGFVGLVIPHILRLIGVTDARYLLPACALSGAAILLLADLIARSALLAAELPIGVVTATLGTPFFIWLLVRAKH